MKRGGKARLNHPVERAAYFLLGAVLLTGWIMLLWGRGWTASSMGPLTQAGSFVVIPFSVGILALALRGSVYARFLFITLASTVATLGVVELFLHLCDCTQTRDVSLRLKRVDTMLEMRKQGIEVYPYIPPGLAQEVTARGYGELFLSHISSSLTVLQEEDDGLIITKTDENGFRNPDGLYNNTAAFDVFLLGDSFTEGCCVADGHTIADYIRQQMPWSVYNAGIGGSGLIQKLATFIEYGIPKLPKNVVLIMPEGVSLNRAASELKIPSLAEYYQQHTSRNLLGKSELKDEVFKREVAARLPEARREIWKQQYGGPDTRSPMRELVTLLNTKSRIVQLVHSNPRSGNWLRVFTTGGYRQQFHGGEGIPSCQLFPDQLAAQKKITINVVAWLDRTVRDYGGKLHVVYVPGSRVDFGKGWDECEHEMMIQLRDELAFELIDLVPLIGNLDDPKKLYATSTLNPAQAGHPNRDGYRFIAEHIVPRLRAHSQSQRH